MELYTLTEASEILKNHNISADYKKLVREATLAKINLSIAAHGNFYSPTIKMKCQSIVDNIRHELHGHEKSIIDKDNITKTFEADFNCEVLNSTDWKMLSNEEKRLYLLRSDSIKLLYEEHTIKPLNGYYIVYPSQLMNQVENTFKIQAVTDGREMFYVYKTVKNDELFITEQHLNQYIESFSTTSSKPQNKSNNISPNITTDDKPWLIANSSDPVAAYTWYISARYFARETLKTEPTLLAKKDTLASRVNTLFKKYGIKKRGGKNDFDDSTIKKAFSNVNFG